MTDQLSTPFSLHATHKELLEEARTVLNDADEKVGDVFEEKVVTDVYFDLTTAILTAYSVLGIIATIGGAVRFIDWILEKVRDFQRTKSKDVIQIVCGSRVITMSRDSDIEAIRSELENLLKTRES